MPSVFINYRVVDQALGAAVIDYALADRFGRERVFRDCVSMQPGEHYPSAMRGALRQADVLVVVIGPDWLTVSDKQAGERLIDRERDWVRQEIEEALKSEKHVVPVLLRDIPSQDGPRSAKAPGPQELPESIRGLALKQVATISHRQLEDDLTRLIDRLIELVPELVIADLFEQPVPPPGTGHAPSALLLPEYGVVPFTGRTEELADLRSWAAGAPACSAMLVAGPAGVGKTRMAQALCDELIAAGWLAGLVQATASATLIGRTAEVSRPVLAVVDDAETRADQLLALAAAFTERSPVRDSPARLLMLARCDGEWLEELRKGRHQRASELFKRVHRLPLESGVGGGEREKQIHVAREALAERLAVAVPDSAVSPPVAGESLVDVHAAVLDELVAGRAQAAGSHPLDRLLQADRRHWRRLALAVGQGHLTTTGLATVATLATLCRPASTEDVAALRQRLPNFLGEDATRVDEYADWLGRLYPARHGLGPVRPAALGERLVAATLAAEPSIATTLAATGTPEQLTNALTVLGQALPDHPELAAVITAFVQVNPPRLIEIGVSVAAWLARPEPFSRALGAATRDQGFTTPDGFLSLLDLLQRGGRGLNPLKAAAMRAVADFGGRLVGGMRPPQGDANPAAQQIQDLSDKLVDFMTDAFTGFLDPESGRLPKQPDGRPIVPPYVLDALRGMIDRGWLRSDQMRDGQD